MSTPTQHYPAEVRTWPWLRKRRMEGRRRIIVLGYPWNHLSSMDVGQISSSSREVQSPIPSFWAQILLWDAFGCGKRIARPISLTHWPAFILRR